MTLSTIMKMVAAWWCVAVAGGCDVTVGDRSYREEVLASGLQALNLAVDFNTHDVYFFFYNRTWYNAKINIRSKVFTVIEELVGQCRYAVDQLRGEVHAGCGNYGGGPGGLYQWDSNTNQFEQTGEDGQDIQFIHYYKDNLYYSFQPDYLLHTFVKGRSVLLTAPSFEVLNLVVDGHEDYIFNNSTGVFRQRRDGADQTHYGAFNDWVRSLAVDGRGTAYTCHTGTPRGIWRLNDRALTATRLLDVACYALTFDAEDNIIYADYTRNSIVRLVQCS